jgi:hypothetical protein
LEDLSQGIGLQVRPFVGARWLHTNATHHSTLTGKPGLDFFYNITPSLKMTGTVNTDFGETEVDARQINLSRFSVFFPEKRSFFLEDAGVFSFASTATSPLPGIPVTGAEAYPFFSRQIGLLNGEEVPIDFGVKLTGKIGRTDIGVLDVRTRDLPTVPEKNFIVGRVRRNFFRQSYIGAIFTRGHPARSIESTTFGADVRLATSTFLGRRNLVLNAYSVRSVNQGNTDRDWSHGVAVEYPNDILQAQLIWRDIQANFRPALGFVQRRNVRMLRVGASYNPRPKELFGIQQMFNAVFYTRFVRLDNGQVESWDLFPTWLDWHFKSGDAIHRFFDPNPTYERLFAPFEISPGVVLPPENTASLVGARMSQLRKNANFPAAQKLPSVRFGQGTQNQLETTLTYKIPPRFTIAFNTNQTFARLPQGNFTARILSWQVKLRRVPVPFAFEFDSI